MYVSQTGVAGQSCDVSDKTDRVSLHYSPRGIVLNIFISVPRIYGHCDVNSGPKST
jgi:hypothetical protein